MDAARPIPTQDERTMALLMYILAIFAGWLSPLIFFFVKRDSKFVGFHALQTLFFHIGYLVLGVCGVILWFVLMISFAAASAADPKAAPPLIIFLLFPMIWGGWVLLWLLNMGICIVFGIKAHNGEWPTLPLFGRWARNLVKV
jgi:uncharacterized membrane protein